MGKIFIRYESSHGPDVRQEVAGFCFDGATQWIHAKDFSERIHGEVKCHTCDANNWTENGRSINEYECGCCGSFVTVEPIN